MHILSLNCQRGYQPGLKDFLRGTLADGKYDFLLLQEFAKEVPAYTQGIGPYNVLKVYDDVVGEAAQVCILYHKRYTLKDSVFHAFRHERPDPVMGSKHSTFGMLAGKFEQNDRKILVGSVHLHSGLSGKARAVQLRKVKEEIAIMQKRVMRP